MRLVLRRVLGGFIVLAALIGLAAGLFGAVKLQPTARVLEQDIVGGLDHGLETFEVVSGTLQVLIKAVDDTAQVVDSAVASSQDTQQTLQSLQPAVLELSDIAGTDLPASVEAIQGAMPALEQAGRTVDRALRTLAAFEWSATIPVVNYRLGLGLGVDYDPDMPLDESIAEVSDGLAELPTQLEGIETGLINTHHNLSETITSIGQVGGNLAAVSQDLAEMSATLHTYSAMTDGATGQLRDMRWNIRDQIARTRLILTAILAWLALSQMAPLYLGCSLLSSGRPLPGREPSEKTAEGATLVQSDESESEQMRVPADGYSRGLDGQ